MTVASVLTDARVPIPLPEAADPWRGAGAGPGRDRIDVHDPRDTLVEAMAHPERSPQLTIRISGYAVHVVRLTPEPLDVVDRTFHGGL